MWAVAQCGEARPGEPHGPVQLVPMSYRGESRFEVIARSNTGPLAGLEGLRISGGDVDGQRGGEEGSVGVDGQGVGGQQPWLKGGSLEACWSHLEGALLGTLQGGGAQ